MTPTSRTHSRGPRPPALAGIGEFAVFAASGVDIYALFVLAPVAMTVSYGRTNRSPFNPPTRFDGLDNYTQPILVCYLVRYFVKGLTGGATQG
ncbi:hypothetical protein OHA79_37600 [Streptomyces sp. NBC_00841]|uniref:hypothetical protein n=1 Tax=unclassified Streptomyces TaxID=2593676 RepID=UPI002257ABCE|nr:MULTISPECIES: hypothetical protein [unclassified Streptomyces]MCX4531360.1 hypothetical protein [Streptomyces sp. NBC_01669]WSA03058.1 hypothetical protein OHA79_37600 [Streptomyces sp. NBC_00841]